MGTTSMGSVTMGLLIALVGIGLVVVGGVIVDEVAFAEGGHQETEHGPFGLFGESESSGAQVNMAAVLGLALGIGGVAALVTGLVVSARAMDRGKDREVELEARGDG